MLYEKAQYAEFNVPTCGKIAVWQLCREKQPVWNSCDGLNLTRLDQCHGVGSHGTSSSEIWRKRIYSLKSKFDRWVYILVFTEGDCCRLPREIGKSRHRTSVFFSVVTEATQDAPKASPRKNLIEQLKPLLEWMLYEKAQYAEFNVPTCGKIAVWQLRRETAFLKQSWWPEFSMFGSMPLCWFPKETPLWASALEQAFATWTAVRPLPPRQGATFCLDHLFLGGQFCLMVCTGRSLRHVKGLCPPVMHPAASKAVVGVHGRRWPLGDNSKCLFTIYITKDTKVINAGLPVDIRVFLSLRKQQPRFAQGQPKKEFHRATKAIAQMNADWKVKENPVCWVQCANKWRDCSLTAVQRKTAFLEPWWPEFDIFGSMPWCSLADAKELL